MADGGLGSPIPSPRLAGAVPGSSAKTDMVLGAGGAKSKTTGSGEFAQVSEGSLKRISHGGVGGRQDGGPCSGGKYSGVC